MNKIIKALQKVETKFIFAERQNTKISAANVGWHIEHIILANNRIIDATKASNPADYKWKFDKNRFFAFLLKKFPRGRAKAPKASLPVSEFNEAEVKLKLELAKQKILELDNLSATHYLDHPFFGKTKLSGVKKVLLIHTNHHLKIIADIIKQS
ncbi:MAG: hypothetical protein ABL929_01800 [Ferruginibacter sp.]|nr:hypothetical protein [Ferruginibacter sp.]